MIKIDKENYKIETDCKTVGELMTEAAAIFDGNVTIIVDGCRYEFHDNPKIKVTDNTPLGDITYTSAPGSITFIVKTKPKPKTANKSGWINIYKVGNNRMTGRYVFSDKIVAETAQNSCEHPRVATIFIEWEEVVK